jgi:predicted permease
MAIPLNDIEYAIRQLRRSPGFTAVAVVSLALGIGANTAIFSLLNTFLLRSLPVHNPNELRLIKWSGYNPSLPGFGGSMITQPDGENIADSFPYSTYVAFRDRLAGTGEVFTYNSMQVTAIAPDGATQESVEMVSGNFFSGYGAKTVVGRPITPDDDQPEAEPVVLISYRYWERHFNRENSVLGRTITLNRHVFTIVGVLGPEFIGPDRTYDSDFYVPLCTQTQLKDYSLLESDGWWMPIMMRIPRSADETQVVTALNVVFNQILTAPDSTSKIDHPSIMLEDGRCGVGGMYRRRAARPLWFLQAVVGLVLLIACANLAGLLLARGAMRRHEMAVRASLGASRSRLVGQLLVEAAILAGIGGVLGLLLAWSGMATLFAGLAHLGNSDLHMDASVLVFTLMVTAGTVLLFGLLPALRNGRADPFDGLRNTRLLAAPRLRFGRALVVVQVALSVLLVVTAGLFIRTFVNLTQVNPGFNVENLLVFCVDGKQTDYKDLQLTAFFDRVRENISEIPNVLAVACSHNTLLSGGHQTSRISIPGRDERLRVSELFVSDSFFRTIGIPMVLGREFDITDNKNAPRVVIVNEAFAQAYFPEGNPVDSVFSISSIDHKIIGVCRDAKYQAVRNDVVPTVYSALRQIDVNRMWFGVRTAVPPLSLVPNIRNALATVDQNIALVGIDTQESLFAQSISQERRFAYLCGSLAVLALLLSCIGLYGLMAYSLARRINEIGIRMAVGARSCDIVKMILKNGFILGLLGIGIGIIGAIGLSRYLKSMLFELSPTDPMTYGIVVIVLLGVTILACYIPARRAARIDPMEALRYE